MTLITINDAAERLGLTYATMRRKVLTGEIAGVCHGTPGTRGAIWEADADAVEVYRVTTRMSDLERAWETTLAQHAPDLLTRGRWFVAFDAARAWRLDWAVPDLRVGVELHGAEFVHGRHTRGSGFIEDRWKMNAARTQGWQVLEFTTTMLRDDPLRCVALLRRMITNLEGPQP